MGRNVKRVPLDFDHPIKEAWPGYLMPDRLRGDQCPSCQHGWAPEGAWLQKVAYVLAGSADDAAQEVRGRALHPWLVPLNDISYGSDVSRPGPKFAELVDGLVGDAGGFMGHDVHRVWHALVKAAGLPEDWGICATCGGNADVESFPGQRAEAEAWEPTGPPTGNGWQMWEDTSEGSPVSPVFATSKALADWCAPNVSVFGDIFADADRWLRIIEGGDFAHVVIAPGVIAM